MPPSDQAARKSAFWLFVDEANVLGKFDALLDGAGELPGYGVSLWTIWHSRSQIAGLYGESGAKPCRPPPKCVNLFNLSRALPDEIEHWSKAIGSFTGYSSTSTTDKSGAKTESTGAAEFRLVPATDLPKLLQKHQIVFLTSPNLTANPIKLARTQAHKDPRFKGLIVPRPPNRQDSVKPASLGITRPTTLHHEQKSTASRRQDDVTAL